MTHYTSELIEVSSEDFDGGAQPSQTSTNAGKSKPRKNGAPRQHFLNDFDLAPEGAPSWKDYAAEMNPQSETNKFLVASAWLQTHGGADPFTGNHLFTCFRAMSWKVQADMTSPLRQLKSTKSYYENASRGQWRLTSVGLGEAEKAGQE